MAWSVIQTQVNAASVAVANLRQQGFAYYNPLVSERVIRKRGGVGWRRVQLFKDYLFVEINDRWRSLLSTRGVSRLLMERPELPARVSGEVIKQLRARENEHGLVHVGRGDKFHLGQSVFVAGGPFKDTAAIYDGQSTQDRAFVLLSLLGKVNRMEVHEGFLTAA